MAEKVILKTHEKLDILRCALATPGSSNADDVVKAYDKFIKAINKEPGD